MTPRGRASIAGGVSGRIAEAPTTESSERTWLALSRWRSWRHREVKERIEIAVDVDVTGDVGARETELAGMGEDARDRVTTQYLYGHAIRARGDGWFSDAAVIRLDTKREFVVEDGGNKGGDVHVSPFPVMVGWPSCFTRNYERMGHRIPFGVAQRPCQDVGPGDRP